MCLCPKYEKVWTDSRYQIIYRFNTKSSPHTQSFVSARTFKKPVLLQKKKRVHLNKVFKQSQALKMKLCNGQQRDSTKNNIAYKIRAIEYWIKVCKNQS